jgi:hypothetical protein
MGTMPEQPSIDFRARSTTTRFSKFGRVFQRNPESEFERSIARLCVLYEDLRIELFGAAMDTPTRIDVLSPDYRRNYFLRRAVATLKEFRDAIDQVRVTAEFRQLEARATRENDKYYLEDWIPAIDFFNANGRTLTTIRNDVGGHFGREAAVNAFEEIAQDYPIRMEIQYDIDDRVQMLLPFVIELSLAALLKHVPGKTAPDKSHTLLDLLQDAVNHAVGAVHFLAAGVIWERMG